MNPSFDRIAPELVRQVLPRRKALLRMGQVGAGAVLATIPVLRITNTAFAQTGQRLGGGSIVDVLNFALTLEYLEESFYRQGLAASGLIPATDRPVFEQIQKHEEAHVDFLTDTINSLGGDPVSFSDDAFDFTGGDGSGSGAYEPFDSYEDFMALAQGFEDTGVRAYKGQATALMSEGGILTAALRIHSVESRHASEVRRMRGLQGWIPFEMTGLPPGFEAIYDGEDNLIHGGVNVAAVSDVSNEEITEAFDEPLTMDAVLDIVDPFVDG